MPVHTWLFCFGSLNACLASNSFSFYTFSPLRYARQIFPFSDPLFPRQFFARVKLKSEIALPPEKT